MSCYFQNNFGNTLQQGSIS